MRFVFIRHGHYAKPAEKSERDRAPLTDAGQRTARQAGEYLAAQGIRPDLVCTTKAQRTRETATIVLETLGASCPTHAKDSGFGSGATGDEITRRIGEWASGVTPRPQTLLYVGHDTQQSALLRRFGGPEIPQANRACVLIWDQAPDGQWLFVGSHAGS